MKNTIPVLIVAICVVICINMMAPFFYGVMRREGFLASAVPASSGIRTLNTTDENLPLKEYCVKASFNSAYSNGQMDVKNIDAVLSRGCRFLDFEVYLIDDAPYVGYAADGTYPSTPAGAVLLASVFKQIVSGGFSAPSPNQGDPLFVRLRIPQSTSVKINNIYKYIAMSISNNLTQFVYSGKVTGDTLIASLAQKIIIVVDKLPTYNTYPVCEGNSSNSCYNLTNYINLISGGDALRCNTYTNILDQYTTPPHINDNNTSDVTLFQMVEPEPVNNTSNPDSTAFFTKYGVQIVLNRFYMDDQNLAKYEHFFSDYGAAFVPFYKIIKN